MPVRRLIVLAVVMIAALGGGTLRPSSSAVAEVTALPSVGASLPVDDFRAIELDQQRGRLYIAQGAGTGLPLVATDLNGQLVTRVDAIMDVSDLALSDDRQALLVAQGFARVTALDARTLTATATYPAPQGACVFTVEPTGDKIVGGFVDCGIGSGGLLVWSPPNPTPVVYTQGPHYQPRIEASPGSTGLLVAGDTGYSPVTTYVIDMSGDSPRLVSRRDNTGSNLQGYAVSPDGTEVVQSVGHPYEHRSYRLPDLADAVTYPSGVYPLNAAWSGDGATVAIGRVSTPSFETDIYLYDKGSTVPTYAVDLRGGDNMWQTGLLLNQDGTRGWAVSYNDPYQETYLLHSFGPAHSPTPPVTDLDVTAATGAGKDKHTAFITVTWTSPIGTSEYWWITASTDGGPEREFWRSQMKPTGTYSLTYELPRGVTTFTVRYRSYDGWYPPGHATTSVTR